MSPFPDTGICSDTENQLYLWKFSHWLYIAHTAAAAVLAVSLFMTTLKGCCMHTLSYVQSAITSYLSGNMQ